MVRRLHRPEGAKRTDGLVHALVALGQGYACGGELLLDVAGADADDQAAVRDDVDAGELLCEHDRIAQGQDDDPARHLEPGRMARDQGQRDCRVEEGKLVAAAALLYAATWIWPALVFGILISAAVSTFVSPQWLSRLLGRHSLRSQVFAGLAGAPLDFRRKNTGHGAAQHHSGPSLVHLLLGRQSQAELRQSLIPERKTNLNKKCAGSSVQHFQCVWHDRAG